MHACKRFLLALGLVVTAAGAGAHCQVPCGIYADDTRFDLMLEHVATIEKSMSEIQRLSADAGANANQLARWVATKETHADALTHIATFYFLAQRIKPVDAAQGEAHALYVRKLTLLHAITVGAMRAKQTTDTAYCDALRRHIAAFKTLYLQGE